MCGLTACLRESKLSHTDTIVVLSSAFPGRTTWGLLDNLFVKPPAGETGGFQSVGVFGGLGR